jgi:hypothetical protein
VGHLTKLTEEYGKKGFHVVSLTGEKADTVRKFLAQQLTAPVGFTIGIQGGTSLKRTDGKNTIPYAYLVGVDGNVLWQGNPGSLPKKELEAELRKVKPAEERRAVRAEKALAHAESLVGAKQVLLGVALFEKVAKEFKGTEAAKTAAARLAEIEKDESLKAELAAQRELERIVGGAEFPKEKLKGAERKQGAARLEAFIKSRKETAPVAAGMAEEWMKVMTEDWKSERK